MNTNTWWIFEKKKRTRKNLCTNVMYVIQFLWKSLKIWVLMNFFAFRILFLFRLPQFDDRGDASCGKMLANKPVIWREIFFAALACSVLIYDTIFHFANKTLNYVFTQMKSKQNAENMHFKFYLFCFFSL